MLLTWKNRLTQLLNIVARLTHRYPGAVALFGFCSGVASFFLVERQARLAKVVALVMLISWLWLTLENILRRFLLSRFGWQLPTALLRYATQVIHQESLFFVIPFFTVTTTWNSGQAIFSGLLGCAALVSVIDPLYYKWLAERRWLYLAFHALTLFAVLLTILPIVFHLSTPQSYRLALGTALILALPSFSGLFANWGWRRLLAIVGLVALTATAGWLGRTWVPPATLRLNQISVTMHLDNHGRAPADSIDRLTVKQLKANGLYAYTAISAPRGLKERIYHEWLYEGRQIDRIALDIKGGREAGYRAWSYKRNFPENPAGKWHVRVTTEAGQLIGILRFEVTR
ncbi:DUF5924 family protein [Azomonas macrocytogenes]|uniref:DUF2914 domain-containing protein n=1 Tax=Azomonas macrocytogenes TaxID=69962 RepID=A0A839T779_AZOMA|nr:DUF5924 family protein [Azomonas macrocytogenes]MBB3104948.1 hypothetical protein [Azomonas macrocytogenes]